jgi:hypothetical protein
MRLRALLLALPLLASGCVTQEMKQAQVKSALINAGLSPPIAQCMAHRLVDQLTTAQLRKLQALRALQGPGHNVGDYIAALARVNDPQVMRVAISSAALCASGWER